MHPDQILIYEILVNGEIDLAWSDWLGGLSLAIRALPDGRCQTALTGSIPDQAALRGIVIKIWDLNLELVSLKQIRTD
jgi:hypothetical protein